MQGIFFSHKYSTFSQQISAPSSSFSEVAFSGPPSVKLRLILSPNSNCFQRRTLRATLHGVSTADQNELTLKSFEECSDDVSFRFQQFFFLNSPYLPLRKVNKRKNETGKKDKRTKIVIILEKTLLVNNQPFLLHQSPNWQPARRI